MTRHKKLTVEEVVQNLLTLLSVSTKHTSNTPVAPYIASQESLVGRRVCHKWKDTDGYEQLYYGKILSLVPGTTD